jgi:hypothetical protein
MQLLGLTESSIELEVPFLVRRERGHRTEGDDL